MPLGIKGFQKGNRHGTALKGRKRVFSEEWKRNIGIGFHNSFLLNGRKKAVRSKEWREKVSRANTGQKRTKEFCKQNSDYRIGKMPKVLMMDGQYGHIKRGHYDINGKDMFFRSKWEANYALYLDFLVKQKEILKWEFEPDMFVFEKIQFGTRSYLPDFKVYDSKGFHYDEVKGWMDDKSKTKLNRMRIYYPDVVINLIDGKAYNELRKRIGKVLHFY